MAKLVDLVSFNASDGSDPVASLTTDKAGNLYGTTTKGGAKGDGTVFEIHRGATTGAYASTPTILVSFNDTDGAGPAGSLITDKAGNLYGTTAYGGAKGDGTVFEIVGKATTGAHAHSPTTLVSFKRPGSGTDGAYPLGSLIADKAGNLYGTTQYGGANDFGTVFEIPRDATTGAYASIPTTLVSFNGSGSGTDGANPQGSLIADKAGNLYGTTAEGGAAGVGTVFEIARNAATGAYASTPTTLVSFNGYAAGTDGAFPDGSLIADAAGNLYGTTQQGGADGDGTVFEIARNPTTGAYASTPTTLVSFNGPGSGTDGAYPQGSLIADKAGNLYGTTFEGGANGDGTVFEIARNPTTGAYASTPTTLVSFNGTNGADPLGSLIADKAGNLYGTTGAGGAKNDGTVFEVKASGFEVAANGFEVTDSGLVVCFAAGTRIRTVRGEAAVETLQVGDHVVTPGGSRPVKWIGHRAIDCRRHPRPHDAWPMRVAANAFGPGRPSRDLHVSPGHSICVDILGEVLIPASKLVNGTTVAQIEVDTVTYWHVELDAHDIVFAEGLPAESYIDMGNRCFFRNADVTDLTASPDGPERVHAGVCRPLLDTGPRVQAARARLRSKSLVLGRTSAATRVA